MTQEENRKSLHELENRLYRATATIQNLTALHRLAAGNPWLLKLLNPQTGKLDQVEAQIGNQNAFNKALNSMLIKTTEEFIASLESYLSDSGIFEHVKEDEKPQFINATYLASFDLIRPPPKEMRLKEFEDPEKYPGEWLAQVGLVRLKSKRIVPMESSEAIKREIRSLMKALQGLNPHTINALASEGASGESIKLLEAAGQKLMAESKRGRTSDIRNERIIRSLALVFAKFTGRRPERSGRNSLFTQYVLACHQAVNSSMTVETILDKIEAYDKRHPFELTFDDTGSVL